MLAGLTATAMLHSQDLALASAQQQAGGDGGGSYG